MTEARVPVPHGAAAPRRYDEYRLWAPAAREMRIRVDGVEHRMAAEDDGWFALPGVPAVVGARYAYRPDGEGPWIPDPRSLSQPDGVHADSEVVDPRALRVDTGWQGRGFRGGVIYELHVGTFTPGPDGRGGTLDSAIERLDDLVELGVDAVELMPLAAFPGERGWGYDGVGLYAVHAAYGGPTALARFVAAAHERGLAVILDVVHNHLGPAGNYLGMLGPYFTDRHETPWGQAVNLDGEGSAQVRAFLLGSVRQWLVDVGVDGLRLDAVHELRDHSEQHFLAELAEATAAWERETGRELTLIAETDRNQPATVTPVAAGGLGMDMQWADDVHHAVHAWATGERDGYYGDFGSTAVLAKTLTGMFLHDGSHSSFRGTAWGAPVDRRSEQYDAHSFVAFLQDHDQVGNRATGDRIHHGLPAGAHAAGIALILLGAPTPMLFQGEEWAASSPFAYFTDHEEELGALVTAGRFEEFAAMDWSGAVPDPQALSTFTDSILDWSERGEAAHSRMLAWYRRLIALRRERDDFRDPDLTRASVRTIGEEAVLLVRGDHAVLAHRGVDEITTDLRPREVLASFGVDAPEPGDGSAPIGLSGPGAVVMRLG